MKRRNIILIVLAFIVVIVSAYLFGRYKIQQEYNNSVNAYPADSEFVTGWSTMEEYEYWKDATFSIPAYQKIPMSFQRAIVKIFIDNKYHETGEYFFTKIKDRAGKVIAYGDFTGNGDKEMAFLLEKRDFTSSAIFIITDKGNLLYWKQMESELPTIKSFTKGAKIYMDKMELVPAPTDGIIRQTKSSKYVLIYNQESKTFDAHYQYTEHDIEAAKSEADMEEYDEADTTEVTE